MGLALRVHIRSDESVRRRLREKRCNPFFDAAVSTTPPLVVTGEFDNRGAEEGPRVTRAALLRWRAWAGGEDKKHTVHSQEAHGISEVRDRPAVPARVPAAAVGANVL